MRKLREKVYLRRYGICTIIGRTFEPMPHYEVCDARGVIPSRQESNFVYGMVNVPMKFTEADFMDMPKREVERAAGLERIPTIPRLVK